MEYLKAFSLEEVDFYTKYSVIGMNFVFIATLIAV